LTVKRAASLDSASKEDTYAMTVVHVLRVFCDSEGQFGSPLGVVLDGPAIPPERRQPLAAELGFPETVYVDDPDTGRLRIFTPAAELPFAGHPLVGTAWLLSRHLSRPVTQLNPPAGAVSTWISADRVWIRAPLAAAPFWRLNHVADATAVDVMTEPPHHGQDADQFWAWIDRQAGTVRARVFAARYGVPEDEACGSASMLLAAHLGRAITIRHGRGSLVQASPALNGMADVGGRVVWDHERAVQ
jgi:predicted PhzF superfamily epimerase YddE/YHI9